MRVLIINPSYNTRSEITNPRNIALLGAVLERARHKVALFDANVMDNFFQFIKGFKPDIIGITSTTSNVKSGLEFAARVKEFDRKIPVIFGGIHATVLPEEILRNDSVDIVVRGEGEITLVELLRKIGGDLSTINGISFKSNGSIYHNQAKGTLHDLDSLPLPAYHLLSLELYDRISIMSSRGCPGRCTFCGSHLLFGYGTRFRSVKRIVDELEILKGYGVKQVWFSDDTLTVDKKRVHSLCEEILKRKLDMKWSCMSRVNSVDKEMLTEMKRAGCITVGFGIESADPEVLKKVKKGIRLDNAESVFRWCEEVGIESCAFLLIGLPGQTWNSIIMTNEFLKRTKPTTTGISILVPYPDTQIYRDMRKSGIISTDNQPWEEFKMSSDMRISSDYIIGLAEQVCDLTREEIIKAYNLLYSTGKRITISKRMMSPKAVIRAVLNIKSKNDIRRHLDSIREMVGKGKPEMTRKL